MIDITIDLETCSRAANAALLQVAAVAWNRHAKNVDSVFPKHLPVFNSVVDLRSCVMEGLSFDQSTCDWWSRQDPKVKASIELADTLPVRTVLERLADWMTEIKDTDGNAQMQVWAQGSDFDISILRTLCDKFCIDLPVSYRDYRDARTFIIEGNLPESTYEDKDAALADHNIIYRNMYQMEGEKLVHNALYDARRTSLNVWQTMRNL